MTPPWQAFLAGGSVTKSDEPSKEQNDRTARGNIAFKELLAGGQRRLQRAEREEQLLEYAEVVGHTGDDELANLLADVHEPNFSRHQNL